LSVHLAFIPIFHTTTPLYTSSQFIAALWSVSWSFPSITSIAREVFSLAPLAEREAAMALGASRPP